MGKGLYVVTAWGCIVYSLFGASEHLCMYQEYCPCSNGWLFYILQYHKPRMQSIIDKLQTPQSFTQSISELMIALNRTNDPAKLSRLEYYLQQVASLTGMLV